MQEYEKPDMGNDRRDAKYRVRIPFPLTRYQKQGFTLVEILLVTVILSIMGLSIYNAFNSGIKIWRRIVGNVKQEDVSIFFEKISHDLRNSFQYADIKLEGTEERISFPSMIVSKEQGVLKSELGYVTYFWNTIDNSINRQQIHYSQLYQNARLSYGQANPLARRLVSNLETMTFRYYYYDAETDRYYWKSVWEEEEENLPLAVRIKVEFYEDKNKNEYKNSFVKTVYIPGCQILPISQEK